MIVIPAIDIQDGKVVRLLKGKFEEKTVYSDAPAVIARNWQKQGAALLHIVDLDGAMTGHMRNLEVIEHIIQKVPVPVQMGGGLRRIDDIYRVLACGVKQVVLGTKAMEDEKFLREAIEKFPGRIVIAIDAIGETVMTKGWTKIQSENIKATDLAKKIERLGIKTIIFTDIGRDGTLQGARLGIFKSIVEKVKIDVIVSGGISSVDDIFAISRIKLPNLAGMIVGKALYERRFSLEEAISVCSQKE